MKKDELEFETFWGAARNWHIAAWALVVLGAIIYSVMVLGAVLDLIKITNLTKFAAISITGEAMVVLGVVLFFIRDRAHLEQAKFMRTLSK